MKEHLRVGDKVEVLCTRIDHVQGSIRLSRKKLLNRKNISRTVSPITMTQQDILPINGVSQDSWGEEAESSKAIEGTDDITDTNDGIQGGLDGTVGSEDSFDMVESDNDHSEDEFESESEDEFDDFLTTEVEATTDETEDRDDSVQIISINGEIVDEYESKSEDRDALDSESEVDRMDDDDSIDRRSWDERFQELVEFKALNGHTNVSTKVKGLGIFVSNQRARFKKGKLEDGQVSRLNGIGFHWNPNDAKWDERFQELVEFKALNGHTNVSTKVKGLGSFVKHQRERFKKGKLEDDRVTRLNEIGFEWSLA